MSNLLVEKEEIERLHRKYAPNDLVYSLVYGHCQIVAEVAVWCACNINKKLNVGLLETAALLHDIGTYVFFDDNGKNTNDRLYPQHAILGYKILIDEGVDARVCDIVSTHVLLGLSKKEIMEGHWPLPARDYEPKTLEGRLLCYADRFHSKHPTFNDFDNFSQRLEKDLPLQAKKFREWSKLFGIPDIKGLAKKYNHPIR